MKIIEQKKKTTPEWETGDVLKVKDLSGKATYYYLIVSEVISTIRSRHNLVNLANGNVLPFSGGYTLTELEITSTSRFGSGNITLIKSSQVEISIKEEE